MRKSLLLLILCVFVGSVSLWAQTKTITGKITGSDDGLPIPGAAIMVKGTSVGTVTNADGVYSLQIPENATTLWVSYMGMKTQEVEIQGRTTINVALQSDTKQVDEVVVTALGISREKKALGYAVTDVKSDEISKSRGGVNNPINALAGKVAGLQITGSSGNLGGSSKVLIRGVKSISGNNQPLFVIDGVPIEDAIEGIETFTGVERRFQYIYDEDFISSYFLFSFFCNRVFLCSTCFRSST